MYFQQQKKQQTKYLKFSELTCINKEGKHPNNSCTGKKSSKCIQGGFETPHCSEQAKVEHKIRPMTPDDFLIWDTNTGDLQE